MKLRSKEEMCQILKAIRSKTPPGEPILVASLATQVNFFSDRPLSGFLNGLAAGIYDDEAWRMRNLQAIKAHPPTIVLAEDNYFQDGEKNIVQTYYPELFDYLTTNYEAGDYRKGKWVLLEKKKGDNERAPR